MLFTFETIASVCYYHDTVVKRLPLPKQWLLIFFFLPILLSDWSSMAHLYYGRFSVNVLLSLCQQSEKRPLAGVVVIGNGQSAHAVAYAGTAMQLPVLWAKGGSTNLRELHPEVRHIFISINNKLCFFSIAISFWQVQVSTPNNLSNAWNVFSICSFSFYQVSLHFFNILLKWNHFPMFKYDVSKHHIWKAGKLKKKKKKKVNTWRMQRRNGRMS